MQSISSSQAGNESVPGTSVKGEDDAVDYFGQFTIGDLTTAGSALSPPLAVDTDVEIEALLAEEGLPSELLTPFPFGDPTKGVFCSRTLNLRSIKVIGYDMDYTLVRYRVQVWEQRAYHYAKEWLCNKGFWVSGLKFKEDLVCRGLIIDKSEGNLLKVDRFGYVRGVMHGTTVLDQTQIQRIYGRSIVDLRESRWSFLNTLFSVSEATLYLQLVDRLDDGSLLANSISPFEAGKCDTYLKLFGAASKSVFRAHVTSKLKSEVLAEPAKFIELDPNLVRTLLDQRLAGKKLVLITNSDWKYTDTIMRYLVNQSPSAATSQTTESSGGGEEEEQAAGTAGSSSSSSSSSPSVKQTSKEASKRRSLLRGQKRWGEAPSLQNWRSLFDVVIVSARKPDFFTGKMPVYEVASGAPPLLGMVGEVETPAAATAAATAAAATAETTTETTTETGDRGGDTLLREVYGLSEGRVYNGGTARMVEKLFDVSKERILYVGDHVFGDVTIAKSSNRWRTLLVLQELEEEVSGLAGTHEVRAELKLLLSRKDRLSDVLNHMRTTLTRIDARIESNRLAAAASASAAAAAAAAAAGGDGGGDGGGELPSLLFLSAEDAVVKAHHEELVRRLLVSLSALDREVEVALKSYGAAVNENWGFMSRAGFSDKSHLMRQIEKYADVYTSRVSNLLRYTPYAYFRAGQQSLAHDGDDLATFLKSEDHH